MFQTFHNIVCVFQYSCNITVRFTYLLGVALSIPSADLKDGRLAGWLDGWRDGWLDGLMAGGPFYRASILKESIIVSIE